MPDQVLWLADVPQNTRLLVGGKASELAALIRLRLPVPPGFVLTTEVHQTAESILGNSEPIRQQIAAALNRLQEFIAPQSNLIVRSSAPFEDTVNFSAAGQLQSVICVPQLEEVLAAVQTCWAAARSAELLDYYRYAGGEGQPYLAVIVQELIETDIAGVMFSGGFGSAIVIEASPGESSRVTSGTVSPDRYVVDRNTHTTLDASGETLSPNQIEVLAAVAERLEAHYGAPQDIEWGFRDGDLFIFQTRPITGQDELFSTADPNDSLIWVSGFFEERFPGAVSPLTWSYLFPAIEQTALREPLLYMGYAV